MSSYGSNPKSQFLRTSSMSSIRAWIENVKQQIQAVLDRVSINHAAQMERYTELKDSDPELAQIKVSLGQTLVSKAPLWKGGLSREQCD